MKLRNIHGLKNIDAYVRYKIGLFSEREKTLETLFELMFDEQDNVMVETTDGYRIHKVTYGAFKQKVLEAARSVSKAFSDVPYGEMIGLYMSNCPDWLVCFWAILVSGYQPLLMNTRLSDDTLNDILKTYNVKGVISDSVTFAVNTVTKDEALAPTEEPMSPRPFGTEILFMSSGTSGQVKLCAYNGENFYYQLCDTANIIATCPDIKRHYHGELKQLVLLPLCHVFGFIAVYLWFGFFSRTFVFPRDLNPSTIQRTVKKHEVTHIFAVPMVWDGVTKAAMNKIRGRGEKTLKSFQRVNALVNATGRFGDFLAGRLLSEVRESLFGNSIMFLISGGSEIGSPTLRFFNGIGYHLANGYGMTEIGIVSVERTGNKKILNSGSIGAPFGYTTHRLNNDGCLLIGGKTRAARILVGGKETLADENEWFATGDMMYCENGRYFANGRADDMIICENGENLAPRLAEKELSVKHVDKVCVFAETDGCVAVVASVPGCYAEERLLSIYHELRAAISNAKLDRVIRRIHFTNEPLLAAGEFKLSRKKIAQRIQSGQLRVFDPTDISHHSEELLSGLEAELQDCFATVLGKEASAIGRDRHFFRDLGGSSLDYHMLLGMIRGRFGTEIQNNGDAPLATVDAFADYIQKNQ